MDPYNNLEDFCKILHPNIVLTPMTLKMIKHCQDMVQTGYPLGITPVCPEPCVEKGPWPCQKAEKKEEIPMASYASAQIVAADSVEKDQRDYARSRIRDIRGAKEAAFEKQFGLIDDARPSTPAEFAKRIADGLYTIDKEHQDVQFYRPSDYIRWRDPKKVEDKAGYKAAVEKLNAAYTKAKDKMILAPVSELEATIDAFDAWTLS